MNSRSPSKSWACGPRPVPSVALFLIALVAVSGIHWPCRADGAAAIASEIEADWLCQDRLRNPKLTLPESDAAGGCDGIITGQYGFHTQNQDRPWWQVDLGRTVLLRRLRIYNRTEFAARASRLMILVSTDGEAFQQVCQNDGTVFYGHSDGRPLRVDLAGVQAGYVRLQLPAKSYFHLDEVEVFADGFDGSIALNRPATQSSVSQWSTAHTAGDYAISATSRAILRGLKLADCLRRLGVDVRSEVLALQEISGRVEDLPADADAPKRLYRQARLAVRRMAFANPLLDFDKILFVKRAPATLPHISDQYYGWWSRPGGGIYILSHLRSGKPSVTCLTPDWPQGSFLRPDLSYDGKRILFAYCRYHPHVAGMEKVDKTRLPEDAFYHIFEMSIDGADVRQLTFGRYDDFDARYLPDGRIVFLSTRKGQFVQCTTANSNATRSATLPDSYVRCGGDNTRPCAVYTLHTMNADGGDFRPISAFETFEYTPSVANDGRLLYTRWDYIDRFNGHFFSLWSANQDGTNPQLVYGNYTKAPQALLEARSIPSSQRIIFTAAAHHSITGGSIALLDPSRGAEGPAPITRLTPEVRFPETEAWDNAYYANPYPLSEDFYLAAWSNHRLPPHAGSSQVTDARNPVNALGIYLCDRFGNLVLIYRDPQISSMYPVPLKPRKRPPVQATNIDWDGVQQGYLLVQNIYDGLQGVAPGRVKRIRVVAVPPKTQPHMNSPCLGVSREDPGKYVVGTAPVESDGSAFFAVPSGVPVFFQALDEQGLAVQTMRTLTYVHPGQTLSCIGCHESRDRAPVSGPSPLAVGRGPSKLVPGPEGSWPLRFDRLVQPVLDRHCVDCHRPDAPNEAAAKLDLRAANSYDALLSFADRDLEKLVFEKDRSDVNNCPASQSRLLAVLTQDPSHKDVVLDEDSFDRLVTWMDTYGQRQGSFSPEQEQQLAAFRTRLAGLFDPRPPSRKP